jgi:hypothetical protein
MADSESIIDGRVVPYSGGRMHTDTNSWRDATDLELHQQARIAQLEEGLSALLDVAYQCDSWESFPSKALEDAEDALGE